MSKYRAYSDLKSIDTNWEVAPSHWTFMQLKRAVDGCKNGLWGSDPDMDDNDIVVVRVADFDRAKLTIKSSGYTLRKIEQKDREHRLLKNGDLLLEKSGGGEKTPVGQVVLFDKNFDAVTSNFVAKMTPLESHNSKFLNYMFACIYDSKLNTCSIKQNTGIQNIDSEAYLSEKFCFPPRYEQTQIAVFLDRETAKIDRLIEKQQRLIELLEEKRQAVISHAVKLSSDSQSSRLSHYVNLTTGFAFPSSEFSHNEDDIRLLRGVNVGVGNVKWRDTVYWPHDCLREFSEYILQTGDIVFGMDRPWISSGARVAMVSKHDLPSLLVQRVARLRALGGLCQAYLYLILSSNEFKSYIEADLTGVSVPHISPEQIKNFPFRVMPEKQQQAVISDTQNKLNKIDEIKSKARKCINLLMERRITLISAAVTGKIDVRDQVPQDVDEAVAS
ncbi:type I restriction endonuclease subunit S [Methylophaga marina]|uniref:Type I restriction modification DNA specificity domain-containing protein n=1 Tax=Methylophaga marina TaxID=45495 RepID=A0ABN0TPT2_9GAMM|nr:restriction endonuclease subunit S [Methylophaga marina]BDZ74378.1 type I restriction endonuclease subunit S [Methylophaga marina]